MSLVIDYVTEEVERQGHDTFTLDGIERVGWMLNAWALMLEIEPETIGVRLIERLGKRVEAVKNENGFRRCGVRVGSRICPSPLEVPSLLQRLIESQADLTPLEFYRQFEEIHPFVDGNGRTGKILLNWKNGTLLQPIFPPNNFWGQEIRNP